MLPIPAQVGELRALAERNGERIDLVLEESRSAREPGRPIFGRLLRMIGAKQVGTIYAWRLDRLARNPVDGGVLIHHLGHERIARIVTPEGAFVGTGNDKLLMQLHFGMATKYVDDLSENVKRGNREVFKSGRITGRPPVGYVKAAGDTRSDTARPVLPDPERFDMVRRLWDLMLTGTTTLGHVQAEARAMGLRTRGDRLRKAGPVSLSALSSMFHNRFYCGEIHRQGQSFAGGHAAMVTAEEFERVQRILGRQRQLGKRWHRTFTYSGLLRCGSCGRVMVGEEHFNRHGSRYVYYRCTRRKPGYQTCAEPYVPERALNEALEASLRRLAFPAQTKKWIERHLETWGLCERSEEERRADEVRKQVEHKETAVRNLTSLQVHGDITVDEFRSQRAALLSDLASLRAALPKQTESPEERTRRLRHALGLAPALLERFATGAVEARRTLLRDAVDHVRVTSRVPTVLLHAGFDALLSLAANGGAPASPKPPVTERIISIAQCRSNTRDACGAPSSSSDASRSTPERPRARSRSAARSPAGASGRTAAAR